MAYRFATSETFADGLQRLARAQIRRVERQLTAPADIDVCVHQSRRTLKRLRSLLAIARPAFAAADWRADDSRIREIGRLLSGARDVKVMLETLERLGTPGTDEATGRGLAALRTAIGQQRLTESGAGPAIPPDALILLGEARRRAKTYGRLDVRIELVTAGLARTYRRGRTAMQRARETGEGEAFHDWRRHVQRHWRHMLLLEEAWPEEVTARARTARDLARILGEDHDIHVLATALEGPLGEAAGKRAVAFLRRRAAERQEALRRHAAPLGLRLFSERAGEIEERMRHYWAAAIELGVIERAGEASRAAYEAALNEEHAET
jgi:CHAD domain-containing protein